MIYILTLIIIISVVVCDPLSHVGSAIFFNKAGNKSCWTDDDLATLRARQIFEQAMPPYVSPEKINSRYINDMLIYFRQALRYVGRDTNEHCAFLLKTALADTIGGHLTKDILPTVRFAYYAGYISYQDVKEAHDFLEEIKIFLNTRGVGWKRPDRIPPWTNLTVMKVSIGQGKLINPCSSLVYKRDSNSCIHLPMPKTDDKADPSAIALPFKSGGLVSLLSPGSENVLLKFYTTASRCILRDSPKKCRHNDFLNFNNQMWHWMKSAVAPHLSDEKLYSAYGGVLRIAAAVQNYGRGLSRRTLYNDEEQERAKWQPWKTLADTYVYVDPDWSPSLYILMVSLAALIICLSQICYSMIFGKLKGCHCVSEGGRSCPAEFEVAPNKTVESAYPAELHHHSSMLYSDRARSKRTRSGTKTTSSRRSMQKQRVYDLHENTENIMAVLMSDNQDSSATESLASKQVSTKSASNGASAREASPPEIETSISQLKFDKKPDATRSVLYSTSTNSRSATTYCNERDTGSAWSATSTTEESVSSGSSKSRSRKTKNSRDLAWARRVASKASQAKSTTSGTEMDVTSFTTPPSKQHT